MLTVNEDAARVEQQLVGGGLACPGCGGVLAGWGWARSRLVRGEGGRRLVRPRRVRCPGCGVTHVLLPVGVLLRRADNVDVIGKALSGQGARPIAAQMGRPLATVRGWLRRFAGRAELLREWFTRLLVALAVDPKVPDPAGSPLADAVTAIEAAADAVVARFAAVSMVTPWRVASVVSQGRLLSPGWPTKWINTSSPWQAVI